MEHFAVKRITSEMTQLQQHPSPSFYAAPVSDDLFDWHFTVKGPEDTAYEKGLYHGRLILPIEYPIKPPKFIILTVTYNQPNGRFETGKEICMSNTSYHPE